MKKESTLFEVSWEVCNMVGGIHSMLASKARFMQSLYGEDRYVAVGPDFAHVDDERPAFREEIWDTRMLDLLAELNVGCRMGRWQVEGEPRCLLINFAGLYARKNDILGRYWEWYQLDSLSGGWDYVEPLLFGHAVGMVLEQVAYRELLPRGENMLVHSHEWLSAAAVLYLEKAAPEVATIFTAHATVLGRDLAARRDHRLYAANAALDPQQTAREFGVFAKHSLEALAARTVDCFTSVSKGTAEECRRFLGVYPHVLLANGLGEEWVAPKQAAAAKQAADAKPDDDRGKVARRRLLELGELATGTRYDRENTFVLLMSGRYEYVNKGIDVYVDALARLHDRLRGSGERMLAFLMVPAAHAGPKRLIQQSLESQTAVTTPQLATHDLRDEAGDPILRRLQETGLRNTGDDPVHLVFVPIYLDGNDSLIPERYRDLLPGADLTAFPAWYEPWGYGAHESIACGIPTVTTDAAGFGQWARQGGTADETGVMVLPRRSLSPEEAARRLADYLEDLLRDWPSRRAGLQSAAAGTGSQATWPKVGQRYTEAHEYALERALPRGYLTSPERFEAFSRQQVVSTSPGGTSVRAHLRDILVQNRIPEKLVPLRELTANSWWYWQPDARELFRTIDADLWRELDYNPSLFLERVSPKKLQLAADSSDYVRRLQDVLNRFRAMQASAAPPKVAFFSAEFGVAHHIRNYSGGLGVLAGDFLKEASDAGIPLCGVGLAYHLGYFRQRIRSDGSQESLYEHFDFAAASLAPVCNDRKEPVIVSVPFPSGPVHARAWRVEVGRVSLYLLDTDFGANRPADRQITNALYGGDKSQRLRQEFILGIGGFLLLEALGINPDVYHMNEGHSAFLIMARLADLMRRQNLKFHEALEYVRRTSIFTTHTPVPAGHDVFSEDLIRPYLVPYEKALQKDWQFLLELGQSPHPKAQPTFSTTLLALKGSARVNGVSRIHGEVSRAMFAEEYPGLHTDEVPITSITNGVHVPTWLAPAWQRMFGEVLGKDWADRQTDAAYWGRLRKVDDARVWQQHVALKQELLQWLKLHIRDAWMRRRESPALISEVLNRLSPDALVIGFARRFATYKRATLLFHDLDRLARFLNEGPPVLLLFAGKAHPADQPGQQLIRQIVEYARLPEFRGRLLFIENYEMEIARRLVAGCDVWLNNPVPPMEASGTSGMKAAINGCLNLSVADGWWPEAWNGKNGWLLGDSGLQAVAGEYQDAHDAAELYGLLEQEVRPLFFERDGRDKGMPPGWVERMKESMATVIPGFSMRRMVGEYHARFYRPALDEAVRLRDNRHEALIDLNRRKERIVRGWDQLLFAGVQIDGLEGESMATGESLRVQVELRHPGLEPDDLAVQVVLARVTTADELEGMRAVDLSRDGSAQGRNTWQGEIGIDEPGPWSMGIRVVPRSPFSTPEGESYLHLVKWL